VSKALRNVNGQLVVAEEVSNGGAEADKVLREKRYIVRVVVVLLGRAVTVCIRSVASGSGA